MEMALKIRLGARLFSKTFPNFYLESEGFFIVLYEVSLFERN
jgi:hypothetical protein